MGRSSDCSILCLSAVLRRARNMTDPHALWRPPGRNILPGTSLVFFHQNCGTIEQLVAGRCGECLNTYRLHLQPDRSFP